MKQKKQQRQATKIKNKDKIDKIAKTSTNWIGQN